MDGFAARRRCGGDDGRRSRKKGAASSLAEPTSWLPSLSCSRLADASPSTVQEVLGHGFRHPGANGMQVQAHRKALCHGARGRLEDRRSIPDVCRMSQPGRCKLRLRERFTMTRESGQDCCPAIQPSFNNFQCSSTTTLRPYDVRIDQSIGNVSALEGWPFPHASAWRECRLD